MSLIDKQLLLKDLESALGDIVTANDRDRVLEVIDNALREYDVERAQSGGGCDPDSRDLLRYFLDAKRVEGRSEKTLERYRYILNRLLQETGIPYAKMTVHSIRHYCSSEQERGIALSTLDGSREVYNSFFGWCSREGLIRQNPMNNLAPFKQPKVIRQPYSPVDMAKLLDAAADPDNSRNTAIIRFLDATGCRVSEMCGLDRDAVDLVNRTVTVHGKGAKDRKVYFDEVTGMYLESYLAEREDDCPALFAGRGSKRLEPGGVRRMLKKVAAAAGVENVHPHRFRRTRATGMIKKGMPIEKVAKMLGHDKLDTTMRYVYIDDTDLANDYRRLA